MILTLDIGNTNIVLIQYDEQKNIIYKKRHITKKAECDVYYNKLLTGFDATVVVVSCVVPAIESIVIDTLKKEYETVINLNYDTLEDFVIKLDDPKAIGADFIATSIAAYEKYKSSVIVADVGSASKLTYTDENGNFHGGTIMPGLGTSVKALHSFIPHLPQVQLEIPDNVVGSNTIGAIQSGIMYGLISQVEGIADKIEKEKGSQAIKIITGGYAPLICEHLEDFIYEEDLVNDGLFYIYKRKHLKK